MKYLLLSDTNMQKLIDAVDDFLTKHPGIVIHSHQFATCGTESRNKYVSIFYDDVPEYLAIKNKNDDQGTKGSL